MDIKILGSGCKKCQNLYENTKNAIQELGIVANIIKVEELSEIFSYSVMSTPAIVINEEVKSSGKVLSSKEVAKIIKEYI